MNDDDLIEFRRDLHRWPEPAGQEERTAALVAGRLRRAGLDETTGVGGHGITHAPDFGADERAIGLGVRAVTGLLSRRLAV